MGLFFLFLAPLLDKICSLGLENPWPPGLDFFAARLVAKFVSLFSPFPIPARRAWRFFFVVSAGLLFFASAECSPVYGALRAGCHWGVLFLFA